jgi:hypothetical protein
MVSPLETETQVDLVVAAGLPVQLLAEPVLPDRVMRAAAGQRVMAAAAAAAVLALRAEPVPQAFAAMAV